MDSDINFKITLETLDAMTRQPRGPSREACSKRLWTVQVVDLQTSEIWQLWKDLRKSEVLARWQYWSESRSQCVLVAFPQWIPGNFSLQYSPPSSLRKTESIIRSSPDN